jgi:hypothetical protein
MTIEAKFSRILIKHHLVECVKQDKVGLLPTSMNDIMYRLFLMRGKTTWSDS